MGGQRAVTIRAFVAPGAGAALDDALSSLAAESMASGPLPLARLAGVHFARLLVVPGVDSGEVVPASLFFASSIDIPEREHIDELARVAGDGLDRTFGHCLDYPAMGERTEATRRAFLQEYVIPTQAFYVNTAGRTVEQVRDEARLHERLQTYLDEQVQHPGWASQTGDAIRGAIQRFVQEEPDLRWALRPAEGVSRTSRLRDYGSLGVVAFLGMLLFPLIVVGAVTSLLLLRIEEWRYARTQVVPHHLVPRTELARVENFAAQNQFSAAGFLKPGLLRSVVATVTLWVAAFGARHLYANGDLGTVRPLGLHGVDTIHFARWVRIDGGRRVVFLSNYDGSFERYMDDFVNKVAWGLNAIFSHGIAYPPTQWLFFGGARDEQAFKAYLRDRQLPTAIWYSAYPELTNSNIRNNAEIRAGLSRELNAEGVARWLQRL